MTIINGYVYDTKENIKHNLPENTFALTLDDGIIYKKVNKEYITPFLSGFVTYLFLDKCTSELLTSNDNVWTTYKGTKLDDDDEKIYDIQEGKIEREYKIKENYVTNSTLANIGNLTTKIQLPKEFNEIQLLETNKIPVSADPDSAYNVIVDNTQYDLSTLFAYSYYQLNGRYYNKINVNNVIEKTELSEASSEAPYIIIGKNQLTIENYPVNPYIPYGVFNNVEYTVRNGDGWFTKDVYPGIFKYVGSGTKTPHIKVEINGFSGEVGTQYAFVVYYSGVILNHQYQSIPNGDSVKEFTNGFSDPKKEYLFVINDFANYENNVTKYNFSSIKITMIEA